MKKETIRFGSLVVSIYDYDYNSPSEIRTRKKYLEIIKNLKKKGCTKEEVLKMNLPYKKILVDQVFH